MKSDIPTTAMTEMAALDHFLCSNPPIKLLSMRINMSVDRENGCPLLLHARSSLASLRNAEQQLQPANYYCDVPAEKLQREIPRRI